jgi:hypothetical protein
MPATIDGGAVAGYTTFNLVMLPIVNDVVDYNTRANFSRKPNPLHVEMIAQSSDTVNPASPIDGAEATDAPVEPAEATGDKPVDVLQTSDTTAGMTPVSQ